MLPGRFATQRCNTQPDVSLVARCFLKTPRSCTVSLLHPVAEDRAEWKPGATIDLRAVLLGLRSANQLTAPVYRTRFSGHSGTLGSSSAGESSESFLLYAAGTGAMVATPSSASRRV